MERWETLAEILLRRVFLEVEIIRASPPATTAPCSCLLS